MAENLKSVSLSGFACHQNDYTRVIQKLAKKDILRCLKDFHFSVPSYLVTAELVQMVKCVAAFCPQLASLTTGSGLRSVESLMELERVVNDSKVASFDVTLDSSGDEYE